MTMALPDAFNDNPQADFRQLRHQTKNALARILAQLSTGLSVNDASRRVAADLERRILLTAQISDALFGLTRAPAPFEQRLWALCEGVVDLASEADQHLTLHCHVEGDVPPAHEQAVLRVAHEFVGNAVKHGMHMRLIGNIDVRIAAGEDGTTLDVTDDGWGCGRAPDHGEGMRVASVLAETCGGRVTLRRCDELTVARLVLGTAPRG
jgi:two-component sensor histidine kinase